jgi:hypothetical protein
MKLAPFNVVPILDVDQDIAVKILKRALTYKDIFRDTITTATLIEQLAYLSLVIA